VRLVSAQISTPLVSAEELADLLAHSNPAPAVLDVRWQLATKADRRAYLEGHIPGAGFVDLDQQLADPPGQRGRHPVPSAERFTSEMRAAGVCGSRPVIVYDDATSMAAARAWWLLRYFGHPEVAVLDGGFAAWVAACRSLQTETPSTKGGDFVARPGGMPVVGADDVGEVAARGVLIDARAQERFRGLVEPIDPVAGHIPGAVNRPTSENVDSDGRFLERSVLRDGFEGLGVRDDLPIAAYCGSGVTAAHEVLALELAGYGAALYPGSWSEWITDPHRPVARETDGR
jgi:thiosulfate/3-mercaptopyruvate sulfurtransferase